MQSRVGLSETTRLMVEIDRTIAKWPFKKQPKGEESAR
jgi:hypothetical protein